MNCSTAAKTATSTSGTLFSLRVIHFQFGSYFEWTVPFFFKERPGDFRLLNWASELDGKS